MAPCPSMKIDNMREEHQEKLIKDASKIAAQQAEAREEREGAEERSAALSPYPSVRVSARSSRDLAWTT